MDNLDRIEQKFCSHCGGITEVKVADKVIPWQGWIEVGIAVDSGCVCEHAVSSLTANRMKAAIEHINLN